MTKLNVIAMIVIVLIPFAMWAQCGICNAKDTSDGCKLDEDNASTANAQAVQLPGYNHAKWISQTHYFTYKFAKQPKLGMATLIVKLYNKDKKISRDYEVYATIDMPSMKGAHSSGDVKLKANKKGELLVPINFVMPGVWQIDLKFVEAGKEVYHGYFTLKI